MFKPPKATNMDLNLAPMVDVMMCLIIFFLLASKMVKAEMFPLDLPKAAAAMEVDKSALGNRVTVNVVRDPDAPDGPAQYVVVEWNHETQNIEQTPRSLEDIEKMMLTRAKAAQDAKQELSCVIRADVDVTYADVERVLRAAGKAKISKMVFAAIQDLYEGEG